MKFHELNVKKNKDGLRVGRGISAGRGKTAGRGTKGQLSRTGSSRKPGFEGGQNPLYKRIPKLRGFKPFWDKPTTITTAQLNEFDGLVDNFTLYDARFTQDPSTVVRVVNRGELKKKLDVKLQGASQGAIDAIVKAGGSFSLTERVKAAKTTDEKQSRVAKKATKSTQ